MVKSLVVNGLARSGTTMLERLIDSQPNMICIGGLFEMLKMIASLRGLPHKGYIATEDFTSPGNRITVQSHERLRALLMSSFFGCISYPLVLYNEHRQRNPGEIIHGMSADDIFTLADAIAEYEPPSDIGGLLREMGQRAGVDVMATKWTQCHRYAPVFLETPESYWVEIVRSPYARITSGRGIGLNELDHVALPMIQDALRFAAQYRHPRFFLVRYERLCEEPDRILHEMSEWLGVDIRNRPLENALGGAFHGNSSINVEAGREYWYQNEQFAPKVGALDSERWRKSLTPADKALINVALDFCGLYAKESDSSASVTAARRRLFRILAYRRVRNAVKAALDAVGLDIVRKTRLTPL